MGIILLGMAIVGVIAAIAAIGAAAFGAIAAFQSERRPGFWWPLAWNGRDLERFRSLLADDVTWYDPGRAAPPAKNAQEAMAFARTVLGACARLAEPALEVQR